jgi:hypothetical protein
LQPGERLPDQRADGVRVSHVLRARAVRQGRDRILAPPPCAPPRAVRVDNDAPQVGIRIGIGLKPRPGLVNLDEAGLDKVLSGMPVAGEQDG